MSDGTIDHATFAELQEAAGAEFVDELVQTFLEEAPVMLNELQQSRASGDADGFRRAAHTLKSNGLTFGALALAAMAREFELGGLPKAQSADALAPLLQEYQRVATALTQLRHG